MFCNHFVRYAVVLLCLGLLLSNDSFSQERCGTVAYTQKLKDNEQIPANDLVFENWLKGIQNSRSARTQQHHGPPYKIPVVIHIIHRGEPIGTGTNISDAQVFSQIKVLNEDFNRENDDASETPSEFLTLAGAMEIEFVLAKQDPEGLPTDGIVRVKGSQDTWTGDDNYEIKSQSYWPSEKYMNIWVCDLVDELVGYAQFPESNLVSGLENNSENPLTDGLVVWHKAFGSDQDGPFNLDPDFNRGRTVTHEVGHFLGLRHIWGDDSGSCSGTDYVGDTPNQAGSTSGCPSHPRNDNCGAQKMFMNFLDYTDDACMNMFTQNQVERMMIVLENSPRRETLLTSPASNLPVEVANDLGIRAILNPTSRACGPQFDPVIEIRNYGSNAVTSTQIQLKLNNVVMQTKSFDVNLPKLAITSLQFDPQVVNTGTNTITFTILQTNGVTDLKPQNNALSTSFTVPQSIEAPFAESFLTQPPNLQIENPDNVVTWAVRNAPKETQNNTALFLNFFDYEEAYGEVDIFYTPVFNLTSADAALLNFDVAHAQYQGSNDRLKVIVLRDCQPLSQGIVVYDKAGSALATKAATNNDFVPGGPADWREEFISLEAFKGYGNIQLAFVGINDWGNNLFLDDIAVSTSASNNLRLQSVKSPSSITCDTSPVPILRIKNLGVAVADYKILYAVNNNPATLVTVTNLPLGSGEEKEIALPEIELIDGENEITFEILEPNGQTDENPTDNIIETLVLVDDSADRIPLREDFEDNGGQWLAFNADGGNTWEPIDTNFGTSYYYNSFGSSDFGDQAWLASPVLDFSNADKAILRFDISNRFNSQVPDDLHLMISKDCGNTFKESEISPFGAFESTEWFPGNVGDWQQDVTYDLQEFVGEEQVRIAFVVTNKGGNNFFIDNIELFVTDPSTVSVSAPFSIYGYDLVDPALTELKITFALEERQDVNFAVIDMTGKFQAHGNLYDVLNQTFPLELEKELAPGVYIVRVQIGGKSYSERIIVQQ